jgi:hypothetical protein
MSSISRPGSLTGALSDADAKNLLDELFQTV